MDNSAISRHLRQQKHKGASRPHGMRLMLVLALVLWLGESDGSVGDVIPRIVDADEIEDTKRI